MRSIKTLALICLLASLATAPAYAKRHGWGSSFDHDSDQSGQVERLSTALDLSPQQRTEMQAIISASRQSTTTLREARAANTSSIRELFASAVLDEARLRELLGKQAELQADKLVAQHATRTRIDQLLTPAQQAKHDDLRQLRMARKGEPGRKGSRCGTPPDADQGL